MTPEQRATAARLADDPRKLLGPIGSFDKHVAWRDEVLAFLRTLAAQPDDAAAGRPLDDPEIAEEFAKAMEELSRG